MNVARDYSPRSDGSVVFLFGASLIVATLALTNQSLWIDEANSALKAMQPSLDSWWRVFVAKKGSDLQMPFYMFYLWAWEKIAGHSEWALRSANVPWFLLANYVLFRACRRNEVNPIRLLTLALLNPFLWFYLNEARPYVMQYGAACVLCAGLLDAAQEPARSTKPISLWILAFGLLVLCGSSLLGVIWAAFAGAAWLYLIRDRLWSLRQRSNLFPIAIAFSCLAALGGYYLWTLRVGGRASDIGRTGLPNLAFVFYELVGAAGLGPGRLEIRQRDLAAFCRFGAILIPLVLGLLLFLALLAAALTCAWRNRSRPAIIAGCIYAIPPIVLLFALGYLQDFRILGRHFTPLLPVILGLFTFGISQMRPRRLAAILFAALTATWLASSLSFRFGERHRKDDYRTATSIAKTALAQREIVWWSADDAAAVYYGLPIGKSAEREANFAVSPVSPELLQSAVPDLVVASKPDIFDPAGQLGHFLREHRFVPVRELPAFTIWRRPGAPSRLP